MLVIFKIWFWKYLYLGHFRRNSAHVNTIEPTSWYHYTCPMVYDTQRYILGVPGLFLNGVVTVVAMRGRKELRPLEIYIVNIAVFDLASIVFMYPLVIPALFMHYWPWGRAGQSEVSMAGPLWGNPWATGQIKSIRSKALIELSKCQWQHHGLSQRQTYGATTDGKVVIMTICTHEQ